MLCRLALALACGLALAAPSLADDNPPPICPGFPCGSSTHVALPRPQAEWRLLASSGVRITPTWRTNRIRYASTLAQARRWEPFLQPRDRTVLHAVDFSVYGVLVIFSADLTRRFTTQAVYLEPGVLTASIQFPPPIDCGGGPCPFIPPVGAGYDLIRIGKGSLPSSVQGL